MNKLVVRVETGGGGFIARALDGAGEERICTASSPALAVRCLALSILGAPVGQLVLERVQGLPGVWEVSVITRRAA
jgi:hypothetical protein